MSKNLYSGKNPSGPSYDAPYSEREFIAYALQELRPILDNVSDHKALFQFTKHLIEKEFKLAIDKNTTLRAPSLAQILYKHCLYVCKTSADKDAAHQHLLSGVVETLGGEGEGFAKGVRRLCDNEKKSAGIRPEAMRVLAISAKQSIDEVKAQFSAITMDYQSFLTKHNLAGVSSVRERVAAIEVSQNEIVLLQENVLLQAPRAQVAARNAVLAVIDDTNDQLAEALNQLEQTRQGNSQDQEIKKLQSKIKLLDEKLNHLTKSVESNKQLKIKFTQDTIQKLVEDFTKLETEKRKLLTIKFTVDELIKEAGVTVTTPVAPTEYAGPGPSGREGDSPAGSSPAQPSALVSVALVAASSSSSSSTPPAPSAAAKPPSLG